MKNILLSLGLSLALVSCAATRIDTPDVSLVDVRFTNVSLFETTLSADVRILNPNDRPIRLRGAVHRIRLQGIEIGKGLSDSALEVPAFGTALQRVDIHLSNLRMLTRVKGILNSEKVDYRIDSTLSLKDEFGSQKHRMSHEGTLDLGQRQFRGGV